MYTKNFFIINLFKKECWQVVFFGFLALAIAYWTYMHHYYLPAGVFWDENYHIASAQKYLAGVMYMEPHPPLGKLMIALGEYLFSPNAGLNLQAFVETDYIKVFPNGYSFVGVRFFPTLFAMLCAPLFFLILWKISHRAFLAFLFSSLYLFDNALIVHSRSAMLESTQLFFILLALLQFVYLLDKKEIALKYYVYLGVFIGLAVTTKLNGLILALLFPFLFYRECRDNFHNIFSFLKDGFIKAIVFGTTILVVFNFIFYIHIALGTSLAKHSSYKASAEYKEIIAKAQTANIVKFPLMLKDNLIFMKEYSAGVPKYDPCKVGENGSLSIAWPFGNKSINYRWEKKENKIAYLYLHGNPIIWFGGFLGVMLAFSLVVARGVFALKPSNERLFFLAFVFTALYFSYMLVMFNIQRVMYLYHYFIPLLFSLFILFTMINYIFEKSIILKNKLFYLSIGLLTAEIIWSYLFFSPLTYYEPLNTIEFLDRTWFDFWKLSPIL